MPRYLFFVLLSGLALGGTAAAAGTREDIMAASARCAGIAADRAWLDCYYGAAQPMRARLGLAPAAAAQVALVPPPATLPRPMTAAPAAPVAMAAPPPKRQGFFARLMGGSKDQPLASYTFDRQGLFTATLSDGSVWQQNRNDVNYAHWRDPAAHYRVAVADGAFGSATLEVSNDGAIYQVHRIH